MACHLFVMNVYDQYKYEKNFKMYSFVFFFFFYKFRTNEHFSQRDIWLPIAVGIFCGAE